MTGLKNMAIDSGHSLRKDTIFSDSYKDEVFWCWYFNNKPQKNKLIEIIPLNEDGQIPAESTIAVWIRQFKARAEPLDNKIQEELSRRATAEKLEMLERHAQHGKELQEIAINYLVEHKDELSTNSAVRLWVEGVRVERESRGLPTLITKISEADDDKLTKMIEDLLNTGDFGKLELLEENVIDGEIIDTDE